MSLNNKDSGFDHNLVEELGYESAMPFLEGKYGGDVCREYKNLILGRDTRITLLHYKDKIISKYTPYYVTSKAEAVGLYGISHPIIGATELSKLRDDRTTADEVQRILEGLANI